VKFSVLLPTRNRLEYLKYAVETVRRQDYADWELVVSDNDSEEDIRSYVDSIDDDRIKYFRTEGFVPVTENWNNALNRSSGDYTIMLGDDDGLMSGYFSHALRLIDQFAAPDLIYGSGYLYAYPGVLPGYPDGLLNHYRNASFLQDATQPFWLGKERAMQLVRDSLNFRMKFTYNMQYSLISRGLIEDLLRDGPCFQSPFPDYYATNAMFLKADRILIDPEPGVAVGITPKSYGFYLFNNREVEGVEFLQAKAPTHADRPRGRQILPGTNMNNSWLLAMEVLARNYGRRYNLKLNYGRYRRLQIVHVMRNRVDGRIPADEFKKLEQEMNPLERAGYGAGLVLITSAMKALSGRPRAVLRQSVRAVEKRLRGSNEWTPDEKTRHYRNMLEVFDGVEAERRDSARAAR
jgi:glycosyltransferase involved in cell wall biosynthesis